MNSPSPSERDYPVHVKRCITWIVGLSPVAAVPSMGLLLFAIAKNGRSWIGFVPLGLAVGFVLIGAVGGLALTSSRGNPWWLIVTLASVAIANRGQVDFSER
jgi:hypothetical protein